MKKKGLFITFEGCEGAGKTTQVQRLFRLLKDDDVPVAVTYEPGGTQVGEKIRSLLLDEELTEGLSERCELLLYFASRAQHIEKVILPALNSGKTVICDRFNDATMAYQGFGRGIDTDKIMMMNNFAAKGLRPDITILIDMDVRKGIERSKKRNRAKQLERELNRMELESLSFHEKVRKGYLSLAEQEKERFRVFSGEKTEDELFEEIKKEVMKCFHKGD